MKKGIAAVAAVAALAAGTLGWTQALAATSDRVAMSEFKFKLAKKSVAKGTVVFRLVNRGSVSHDLKIAGKRSAKIAPGKRGTLRVTFSRPGRYKYLCTLPGHAASGMKGVLRVR